MYVWNEDCIEKQSIGMNPKRRLCEGIVVLIALYGTETWNVRQNEGKRLDVYEIRCWSSMVSITRMGKVRNEDVRQDVRVRIV